MFRKQSHRHFFKQLLIEINLESGDKFVYVRKTWSFTPLSTRDRTQIATVSVYSITLSAVVDVY